SVTGVQTCALPILLKHITSGFITMIKPDVICFNTDPSTMRFATKAATVSAYALSSFYIRSLLAAKGYKGIFPLANAMWASSVKRIKATKTKFSNSKLGQQQK